MHLSSCRSKSNALVVCSLAANDMEKVDEIADRIGKVNGIEGEINPRRMVPSLDHFHTPRLQRRTPGTFDPSIGPERWMEFLDKTGLEYSVLYPTEGLAYGQISFPQWAVAYARGYNDWLFEKYLQFSPKFKGVALIPIQDVPSAVIELRRAVNELGMTLNDPEARLRDMERMGFDAQMLFPSTLYAHMRQIGKKI